MLGHLHRNSPNVASPGPTDSRRRLLVIVNPHATAVSPKLRSLVLHALRAQYKVEVADTTHRGHATELARRAVASVSDPPDAVVAFGGDGTLNEVANGLANTAIPMAMLPGGNANVYCRMLDVPGDLFDATEQLLARADAWTVRTVDLGRLGDRLFLFAAGVGLDASVVERVDAHPHSKSWFRDVFYVGSAISTFVAQYLHNPPRLSVSADQQAAIDGFSLFIQNSDTYTFLKSRPLELVRGSALDSGDISAVLLRTHHLRHVPGIVARVLSTKRPVASHPRVDELPMCKALTVTSRDGRPLPMQVDGDHIGESTTIEVGVLPGALRVLG